MIYAAEHLIKAIREQLSAFEFAAPTDIDISVNGSTVTLSGFVGTATERRRVEKLVQGMRGVGSVVNRLEVKSPQKKKLQPSGR